MEMGRALVTAPFSPSTANQLCSADPDEQKAPAAVHAAAAAAVLSASRHESCADVEAAASQFNDESFQLPADRSERDVSIGGGGCRHAPTALAPRAPFDEWQKPRTIQREIKSDFALNV